VRTSTKLVAANIEDDKSVNCMREASHDDHDIFTFSLYFTPSCL